MPDILALTSKFDNWYELKDFKGKKTGDVHLELEFKNAPPPPALKRKTLADRGGSKSTKEGEKK